MSTPPSTITVGELIDRGEADIQTGPFGTQLKASEYVASGTPVINVRNVGFGDIRDSKLEFITEAKTEKLKNHLLKKGDIVFGRKGAVERHALIADEQTGWVQGSDCLRLRLYSKSVCRRYVSYYLRTQAHQDWMQALCSFGATMASLNQDIVKRITILLPELHVQSKIAAILTSYDDLIETNKRRIALLEKTAMEVYREWFIRMRFPGHQNTKFVKGLPSSWPITRIGNVVSFNKGLSYAGKHLCDEHQGIPMVNLKCFRVGGHFRKDGVKFYDGAYRPQHEVQSGDIVLANTDLTQAGDIIGNPALVPNLNYGGKMIISHHLCAVRLGEHVNSKLFFYHLLLSQSFKGHAFGFANGATVLGLRTDDIERFPFLMPEERLMEKFCDFINPIYDEISSLHKANEMLHSVRTLLLPRLISGKLSVENLDIQFPPIMLDESNSMKPVHA